MISAVLLAAGESRRFGAPKLLQLVQGAPVITESAMRLFRARSNHVLANDLIVVIEKPKHESPIALTLERFGFTFVVSPGGGMASSLAAGVAAVHPDSQALLVVLGDEPFIPDGVIEQLVARFNQGGAHVIVPRYRGVRGHPVLFARATYPELLQLTGDHGARAVADRDPSRLAYVDIDLPKPVDVDTPEDLARLEDPGHHSSP